jgi:hypothetical protein
LVPVAETILPLVVVAILWEAFALLGPFPPKFFPSVETIVSGKDFKQNPAKVGEVIYGFFTSKGYKMSGETFNKALANVEVEPGARPYLQQIAEGLLKEKKISAMPDWNKALRPQFMEKARG